MQSLVKQFWKSTAAITMLLAAGCGVLDDSYVAPDVCPMPTILEDLQELVRFKPGMGTDISQAQFHVKLNTFGGICDICLLYTSPSPRDKRQSRMPSSA